MPLRQSLLAVCLALMLVTAGCNALGGGDGGDDTTTTTTPSPESNTTTTTTTTETTETTTTTRNATSFPPGIAENGTVMDASALANAHHQILLEKGVVWHANRNSTQFLNVSYEQRIATGGDSIYRVRNVIPTSEQETLWTNDSIILRRAQAENGTTTYSSEWIGAGGLPEQGPLMERATDMWMIEGAIQNATPVRSQMTIVDTEVIDGVRYTTVRVVRKGEDVPLPYRKYGNTTTMTFNVSGTGVVHSYEFTYPERDNGTGTYSFELEELGDVTVERPDWASEALNETND